MMDELCMYDSKQGCINTRHVQRESRSAATFVAWSALINGLMEIRCAGNPAVMPINRFRPEALRPRLSLGCALMDVNVITCFNCVNSIYIIFIK